MEKYLPIPAERTKEKQEEGREREINKGLSLPRNPREGGRRRRRNPNQKLSARVCPIREEPPFPSRVSHYL